MVLPNTSQQQPPMTCMSQERHEDKIKYYEKNENMGIISGGEEEDDNENDVRSVLTTLTYDSSTVFEDAIETESLMSDIEDDRNEEKKSDSKSSPISRASSCSPPSIVLATPDSSVASDSHCRIDIDKEDGYSGDHVSLASSAVKIDPIVHHVIPEPPLQWVQHHQKKHHSYHPQQQQQSLKTASFSSVDDNRSTQQEPVPLECSTTHDDVISNLRKQLQEKDDIINTLTQRVRQLESDRGNEGGNQDTQQNECVQPQTPAHSSPTPLSDMLSDMRVNAQTVQGNMDSVQDRIHHLRRKERIINKHRQAMKTLARQVQQFTVNQIEETNATYVKWNEECSMLRNDNAQLNSTIDELRDEWTELEYKLIDRESKVMNEMSALRAALESAKRDVINAHKKHETDSMHSKEREQILQSQIEKSRSDWDVAMRTFTAVAAKRDKLLMENKELERLCVRLLGMLETS